MKKEILLIILLLTCRFSNAQNLVPNGNFEQYISCPTDWSQLDSATFWINPGINSPDYYNACATNGHCSVPYNSFGFQIPHSGQGYGGIYLWQNNASNIREFMETSLLTPLTANVCYYFEMYVNLQNVDDYTTDDIQVYFVDSLVMGNSFFWPIPVIPQMSNNSGNVFDTLNWTLVSGNYTAVGGENHLIIGNFFLDVNTTIINITGTNHPYIYVYVDDVSLTPCTDIEEPNEDAGIKIYPNPAINKLNIIVNSQEPSEIILYDVALRKLLQQKFTNTVTLNTEQLVKGVYIYEVRYKNGLCKKGKVVKD